MMLSFHSSGILVAYTVAGALSFLMAGLTRQRRQVPSAVPLTVLFAGTGLWCTLNALEFAVLDVALKTFLAHVSYVPAFFLPVCLFQFVSVFARRTPEGPSRRTPLLLFVVPVATAVLTFIQGHRLILTDIEYSAARNVLTYGHGWWFWLAVGYSYALAAFAALRLVHAAVALRWAYRRRILAILVPAMLIWIASSVYTFASPTYSLFDLNPLAFLAASIVFFHAAIRYRFQDIRPVAKERVLEAMPDGLLVFDSEGLLVDMNQAALHFLQISGLQSDDATKTALLGKTPLELVGVYSRHIDEDVPHRELEVPFPDGTQRIFDVMLSHVAHQDGESAGTAVLFRDITRYRQLELGQRRLHALQSRLLDAAHSLSVVRDRDSVAGAVAGLASTVVPSDGVIVFRLLGPRAIVTAAQGPVFLEIGSEVLVSKEFFSGCLSARALSETHESIRVPTGSPDRPDGAIAFLRRPGAGFTEEERDAASLFAIYASAALENARMFSELSRHATVDSLTRIYNRRQFLLIAENAVITASRQGRDLSVLMVDIDRFKEINDNFGHAAGDEVLVGVASLLQENLRSSEIVGRYGGDEFLVLLENTDAHQAFGTAERLRERTEESLVELGGATIQVTLSIGVAALGPGARTLEMLLEQSDRGLYLSKNTGRNQTCVAAV